MSDTYLDIEEFEVMMSDKTNDFGKVKWDFYEKLQSRGYKFTSKQQFDDLYDDLSFILGTHDDVQKEIMGIFKSEKYQKFCKTHGFYDV